MSGEATPRVNAVRLANYQGRQVRLPCKIVEVKGNTALVEASDGGQVEVSLNQEANLSEPYAEIIGRVTSANGLKMVFAINMGDNIEMKLVNDTIELMHDPRFSHMFMGS